MMLKNNGTHLFSFNHLSNREISITNDLAVFEMGLTGVGGITVASHGDFWRFGDDHNFVDKMVFYIETRHLDCDVTIVLL